MHPIRTRRENLIYALQLASKTVAVTMSPTRHASKIGIPLAFLFVSVDSEPVDSSSSASSAARAAEGLPPGAAGALAVVSLPDGAAMRDASIGCIC